MAIKYLDSRRISGLSTETNPSPTFEDDFSSYADQSSANTSWVSSDSQAQVDVGNDYLVFDEDGDGSPHIVYYDLGSALDDTAWVWRFKLTTNTFTMNTDPTPQIVHIRFSNNTGQRDTTTEDGIGISFRTSDGNQQYIRSEYSDGAIFGTFSNLSTTISTGTRYVEITRTSSTTFTIKLYSDSSYSTLVETKNTTIPSTVTGLRYLKIDNYDNDGTGNGRILFYIDDIKIYNGVTSITTNYKPKAALSLSGCKAYYNFEQTSGSLTNIATTANGFDDGLGSSADGTVTGATQNATGKVGSYAYSFDGSNDTVQLGSSYSDLNFLHDGSSWSIAFWFKDDNSSQTSRIFSTMDDRSGSQRGISLVHETTGLNLGVFTGTASQYPFASTISSVFTDTNTWHHYVLTFTTGGSTATLYKDGSSFGTWTKTGASFNTSNATQYPYIASRFGFDSFMGGDIDEFVIFNRALTSSEVSTLYNSGTGREITSSLASAPETNSIFVETDTAKRYWFNGIEWILEPTYQTNFSSSSAWTQTGTYVTIDTANNSLTWDGIRTSSSHGLHHDLGANIVSSKWLLEFDFVLDSYSGGTYTHMVGVMLTDVDSTGGTYGSDATRKFVGMRLNWRTDTGSQQRKFYIVDDEGGTEGWSDNAPYNTPDDSTAQGFPSAGTTYHMKLIKDGSSHSLEIWNSSQTSLLDTLNGSNSTTADIRYILVQTYNASATESSTFNGKIQNMKFYNGITSV